MKRWNVLLALLVCVILIIPCIVHGSNCDYYDCYGHHDWFNRANYREIRVWDKNETYHNCERIWQDKCNCCGEQIDWPGGSWVDEERHWYDTDHPIKKEDYGFYINNSAHQKKVRVTVKCRCGRTTTDTQGEGSWCTHNYSITSVQTKKFGNSVLPWRIVHKCVCGKDNGVYQYLR